MEYRVIGLNLARRTDRWKLFYDWHLGLGIPPDWIERWNGRDGMDWKRDGWKAGDPYPELVDAALDATGETFLSYKNPIRGMESVIIAGNGRLSRASNISPAGGQQTIRFHAR